MKKLTSYSIRIHLAIFCSFLFPFFYVGCDKAVTTEGTAKDSVAVEVPVEEAVADTTEISKADSVTTEVSDTLSGNNNSETSNEEAQDYEEKYRNPPNEYKERTPNICRKLPFLKPLLVPEDDTYSGIAIIIDLLPYYFFYAIVISGILLILSFFAKLFDSQSWKTIVFMEIVSLISLYLSVAIGFKSKHLWGYWIAFSLVLALSILDIFILGEKVKKKT